MTEAPLTHQAMTDWVGVFPDVTELDQLRIDHLIMRVGWFQPMQDFDIAKRRGVTLLQWARDGSPPAPSTFDTIEVVNGRCLTAIIKRKAFFVRPQTYRVSPDRLCEIEPLLVQWMALKW